jgi:REP element-mobilizing transposase RayT
MPDRPHSHLPRLDKAHYQGAAIVHWTFAMEDRAVGWLDDLAHARIRELLVHMVCRYELVCPVYCVMPDHIHMILMGISSLSDQRKAVLFLRRQLNGLLGVSDVRLQKQAYDHVLREQEREQGAFEKIAWYVLENPLRAGLVKSREEWKYSGCVVFGHPGWNVFHDEFWDSFWKEYEVSRRRKSHGLAPAATIEDYKQRESHALPGAATIEDNKQRQNHGLAPAATHW